MLTLKIDTDNAAFHGDGDQVSDTDALRCECARILRAVAHDLEELYDFSTWRTLFDSNGNDVGRVRVSS